jgi:hypothetical protein
MYELFSTPKWETKATLLGDIIFGGVDRWKYRGYLEPIEIWPNPSDQKELYGQVG